MRPTPAVADLELALDASELARRVLWSCLLIELCLFVLDYHVNYGRATSIGAVRRTFNTAREDSLASWFATTQTLLVALTLWVLYALAKRREGGRRVVLGWLVLALFFSYMAVDDGAQIHERLGTAFRSAAGASVDFFPSYTWQLVFLPGFLLLGLFAFLFLWRQLGELRARALMIGAFSLLALAVGLDFVEGLDPDHSWNLHTSLIERVDIEPWTRARFGRSDFDTVRHFSKSLEETIEMAAMSIFWFLFLRELPRTAASLQVRLAATGDV